MSSQAPNVAIESLELPHSTSSIDGSTRRIALPASAASRPYSTAVLWPTCHGPSISLPRHHIRTFHGSAWPFATRRSDQRDPGAPLQYSTSARAASRPRVPRLTAMIGSTPASLAQDRNSSVPTWFDSKERQARSRRTGRAARGPTPSFRSRTRTPSCRPGSAWW